MDDILAALNDWRNGTLFQAWLPYLRAGVAFLFGLCWGVAIAVLQPEDVLAQWKAAIKLAGLSDKEAAYYCGESKSHWSERMSGVLPFTMQMAAKLPVEVWQWFHILGNRHVGTPELVRSGARLARRQVRISLVNPTKAGIA